MCDHTWLAVRDSLYATHCTWLAVCGSQYVTRCTWTASVGCYNTTYAAMKIFTRYISGLDIAAWYSLALNLSPEMCC